MRRLGITAAIALAFLLPSSAQAQTTGGIDGTCALALSRLDPTTTNVLALDTNAVYWVAGYSAVPGTRIRIEGQFPYSRYMAFNVYDSAGRPINALADYEIKPDRGSTNPFLPDANRFAERRSYTAFIEFGPAPRKPSRNTMYTGDSDGGSFWYRVYIPDNGRDEKGGVPLPRITYEGPLSLPSADACRELQAPYLQAVNDQIANAPGIADITQDGQGYPGRNPPQWRLFQNLSQSATEILLNNETGEGFYDDAQQFQNDGPGFFSSKHISYVFTGSSRGFGEVLVLHGRAPTFADTRYGAPTMPSGQQLRYFSFCQYEPATQRVIDCRSDDRVALNPDGTYTVVVSNAEQRPSCAQNWIAWGPQTQGLLIYRHMLADRSFANAIQQIPEPGLEQQTMADYYPSGTYLPDAAAYEQQYCPAQAG